MTAPPPQRALRLPALVLAAVFAVALLAVSPPTRADAATRYAAPGGVGASPCLHSDPCDLETAVETGAGGLADGDTVLLAPGTYSPSASVQVFRAVTLAGEPGGAAPLIEGAGQWGLFMQDPSTIRDVRIDSHAGAQAGLYLAAGTAERVEATGEAAVACALGNATLRDALCSSIVSGGGGEGVSMFLSAPFALSEEAHLFNVTAIGGSVGIAVLANELASVSLSASNTIASGAEHDVLAHAFATTASVSADLSHSNFADVLVEGDHAEVTSPLAAGNQTAPPLFVDAAAGNYREAPASPTRGAGDGAVVVPGETDLAGQPRTDCAGTGVDIGAYQFQVECPPPPAPPAPSGSSTSTRPAPKGIVDLLVPKPHCTVPSLSGRTLKGARKVARRSGCKIGTVSGEKRATSKVVAQHPKAGRDLPAGSGVNVTVAPAAPGKKR